MVERTSMARYIGHRTHGICAREHTGLCPFTPYFPVFRSVPGRAFPSYDDAY